MDTKARALAIIGDREKVASRELVNRLWPDWQRTYGTLQRAGYALAKALDVRPRREQTPEGYRSYYYRDDFNGEPKRGWPPAPQPAPVTQLAPRTRDREQTPGLVRCGTCKMNNMVGMDTCHNCTASLA